jgi:hypothetical protein
MFAKAVWLLWRYAGAQDWCGQPSGKVSDGFGVTDGFTVIHGKRQYKRQWQEEE